tara:strand:- start:813 stop:1229 length:417 start_codon:yes stop_codon:yes gene_type:complete
MLSIFLFSTIILYKYIGNYIFFIPTILLYLNYVKVNKLNNYENINNYIETKINYITKFNYKNFVLNNSNNKLLYFFIKFDNIILIISNEFLLFILYYLKICVKYLITNQFTYNFKTNITQNNINERKKNIINLVNKNN